MTKAQGYFIMFCIIAITALILINLIDGRAQQHIQQWYDYERAKVN